MDRKQESGRRLTRKDMVGTGGLEPLSELIEKRRKKSLLYEPSRTFTVAGDGFYGVFYEPAESAFPGKAMIVCSGNEGSFVQTRAVAEKFLEAGMPAIALGIWNTEGTPEDACLIPVEYMRSACRWLIREKGLEPGVWGMSLGAQYALLCASLLPEIACVVAASPLHILTANCSFKRALHLTDRAPFTYRGIALPYLALSKAEIRKYSARLGRNILFKREPDLLFYYKEIFSNPGCAQAEIKVEQIRGPILLLSGGRDVFFPSKWACRQIMNRLHKNQFPSTYIHHNYEVLSNFVCPARPSTAGVFHEERAHKAECDLNRENSWKDTLAFLRDRWSVKKS